MPRSWRLSQTGRARPAAAGAPIQEQSMSRDVVVVVGSLRKGSFTRMTARALAELAPESLKLEIVEIRDLDRYDQDLEDENRPPQSWVRFRDRIRPADAVLFATPEYNRSVPGVLKNAIDVGSRPYGRSVWSRKPAAVISTSPGAIGGFAANHHLRQALVFLDMPVLQQPEAYVGQIAGFFGPDGRLVSDSGRAFLKAFVDAFAGWIERVSLPAAPS
jgi:chromate reductase